MRQLFPRYTLHQTLWVKAVLVSSILLLSLLHAATHAPVHAQDLPPTQAATRTWITPRNGKPFFVVGANYEGPVDRAWQMWDDDKFSPDLIDADFARARSIGVNTMRIFVQRTLRDSIDAGDFSKLDTVAGIARKNELSLILTFTDWPEPDLTRAGNLNGRIAAHLRSEPAILAYDAKNEPQFTDIVGSIYPTGTLVPMQTPDLVALYGERIPRASIGDYRRGEGKNIIPARMTDDQAYAVGNYYKLYLEFLNAGASWVGTHSGTTTLDYMDSPDSSAWAPFLGAMDTTLQAWVQAQIDPVRLADPGRPVTVGYSNIVFAKMPSNRELTFSALHRFTPHGYSGLSASLLVLDNLQRTFAGQPLLLEEFGYPGQVRNSSGGITGYDPRTTANLESAIWAYLYSRGYAGGGKWMLNNYPGGDDPAENSYGLFDNSGKPKVTALALRQVTNLLSHSSGGSMSNLHSDYNYAVDYSYVSRDALIVGGKVYTGTNVTFQANAPAQLVVGTQGGSVTLFSTDVATTTLNLPGIFGIAVSDLGRVNLVGIDPQGQPWTPSQPSMSGDWLQVSISPLYRYRLTVVPRAVDPAGAQPDPSTVYFPQTEHNLSGAFLDYWQQHGGLSIFGYPLSEPFIENGYTVQYFERNRFELHPENQPPFNVPLGRLGADAIAGSGKNYPTVEAFTSTSNRRYVPETKHSLSYAFLGYWNRNGGLAQFGYPITEEVREVSPTDGREYTVQYFERGRMEYHPENKGTPAEVLLGLLSVANMKSKGWLP
ncbi:MAG: hypothetical protein M3014_04330 [Chloroflexota bacterium]|nr:hypothetical protein [Chloroflexota bacterium]